MWFLIPDYVVPSMSWNHLIGDYRCDFYNSKHVQKSNCPLDTFIQAKLGNKDSKS